MTPSQKSSCSNSSATCVEVAFTGQTPARDTKNQDGPTLVFPSTAWQAFLRSATI
jgi:hypothetical protein